MTPVIDGKVHHFESRGLYDGVSLLWDRESGSYWHHITGQALYGPLAGTRLPVANVLHMTVKEALAAHPDIRVAISDRPVRGRRSRWWPLARRVPGLSRLFRSTMAGEDTRRPEMDVGLGVWTDRVQRYYPLETLAAQGNVLFDELDGRRLLVYFDPEAHAPAAVYTTARSAVWEGKALRLDTGDVVRNGVLIRPDGGRRRLERPLQVFTRWYGFALTFPGTEIYER